MASIQTQTLKSGGRSYRLEWRDASTGKQITKRFKRHGDAVRHKAKVEHQLHEGTYAARASARSGRGAHGPLPQNRSPRREHRQDDAALDGSVHRAQSRQQKPFLHHGGVRAFLADLRSDGVGEPTIDHVYQTLRAVGPLAFASTGRRLG
jgi:hypothetical protein